MKNLKIVIVYIELVLLYIELVLRGIALYISFIVSILVTYGYVIVEISGVKKFNELVGIIGDDPVRASVVYHQLVVTPLLISIFILVATRKFKEINQLLKDKKEEKNINYY